MFAELLYACRVLPGCGRLCLSSKWRWSMCLLASQWLILIKAMCNLGKKKTGPTPTWTNISESILISPWWLTTVHVTSPLKLRPTSQVINLSLSLSYSLSLFIYLRWLKKMIHSNIVIFNVVIQYIDIKFKWKIKIKLIFHDILVGG